MNVGYSLSLWQWAGWPANICQYIFSSCLQGFSGVLFYISLPDSLSAAESITCAFSDLSVLEKKKPAFILGTNMCSDEREIFLSFLSQVKVSMFNIPFHICLEHFGEPPAVNNNKAGAALTSRSHCAPPLALEPMRCKHSLLRGRRIHTVVTKYFLTPGQSGSEELI